MATANCSLREDARAWTSSRRRRPSSVRRQVALAAWIAFLLVVSACAKEDYEATRREAEQGDAIAQERLGTMYAEGRGMAQDDAEAVRWWRLAAEQGLAAAQGNLGFMYFNGRGVAQDDAEAIQWYRLAAEEGDAAAQSNLGLMYREGRGVAQDNTEAVGWYRLAAEQGSCHRAVQSWADAQERLGRGAR